MQPKTPVVWDIFCAVVDNFGDIGICWRLSRQLAAEHGIRQRLWVDDLHSFNKICPQVDVNESVQQVLGVEVRHWTSDIDWHAINVADVVIEALACTIPAAYQQAMAQSEVTPIWINLEYLSAESWVEGCHALASPQPALALNKYFFFPGFTAATGGLLQEQSLQQAASEFIASKPAQQAFWQQLGIDTTEQSLKISLFGYDHPRLASLLQCWHDSPQPLLCVVPQGDLANQLQQYIEHSSALRWQQGRVQFGAVQLQILPFLAQQDYDKLLWACDINFVRGEDSIIRAHWAAKPFVWQIYRQQQQAHLVKLQAFLDRYTHAMPTELKQLTENMMLSWNTDTDLTHSWHHFVQAAAKLAEYNQIWRQQLTSHGDLASNLVHFVEKKFIMRRNLS